VIIVSDNIKLLTDPIVNSLTEICFYDDFLLIISQIMNKSNFKLKKTKVEIF